MVAPAFLDSVMAAQSTFRAVLDATARPGTIVRLGEPSNAPPPLGAAAGAVALTLCDQDTPVWLDPYLRSSSALIDWLRFHSGARVIDDPHAATFAFVGATQELPPLDQFNPGTAEYPDRSTTIILEVQSFEHGPSYVLAGPGIAGERTIRVSALPADMTERLAANRRLFPCGIDLLLATDTDIMALPRSVRLTNGAR